MIELIISGSLRVTRTWFIELKIIQGMTLKIFLKKLKISLYY